MRKCFPPIPITPFFPVLLQHWRCPETPAHPCAPQLQDCTIPACFQFWISATLPFWPGNVSPGPPRARRAIPIDRVDWHLARTGQSQDTGVQQPGQQSSPEPSRCSCSLSAPWGRCQPGPFPAARHLTPGTVRWHLLLPAVESCAGRRQGREGTRQISLGYVGIFLGFELVLSCTSFWQRLLESVSCSPASGCGSLGFMSGSLLLRAGWLFVLSQGVSWALMGQIILCPFPSWVLALLDVLKSFFCLCPGQWCSCIFASSPGLCSETPETIYFCFQC